MRFRGDQKTLIEWCEKAGWNPNSLAAFLGESQRSIARYWSLERELPKELFDKILKEAFDNPKKANRQACG